MAQWDTVMWSNRVLLPPMGNREILFFTNRLRGFDILTVIRAG